MPYTSYISYKLLVEEIARKISDHYHLSYEDVSDYLMKEMKVDTEEK